MDIAFAVSKQTAHSLTVLGDNLVALEDRVLDVEKQKGFNLTKFIPIMIFKTGLAQYDLESLSGKKPMELKRWVLLENT